MVQISFCYLSGAPGPRVLPVAVAPLDLLALVDEGQHAGVAVRRPARGPVDKTSHVKKFKNYMR